MRFPFTTLITDMKLVLRAFEYISDNPDIFNIVKLMKLDEAAVPTSGLLVIIEEGGRVRFSLILNHPDLSSGEGRRRTANLPLKFFSRLNGDRLEWLKNTLSSLENEIGYIGMGILLNGGSFDRFKIWLKNGRGDPFILSAHAIAQEVVNRSIVVYPLRQEIDTIISIGVEDAIRRFAGRFGLYLDYRSNPFKALKGIWYLLSSLPLLLLSPWGERDRVRGAIGFWGRN